MSLFRPATLTDDDHAVIASVEQLRERLRFNIAAPRRWTGRLRRYSLARAIRGSNSIEGFNVDQDDAFAAVMDEDPATAMKEAWQAVTGYRDAMTYALSLATDKSFEHSEALIKALHFMIQRYDMDKWPGRYRPGTIYVFNDDEGIPVYEGPDAERVPDLMKELVTELNKPSDESTPVMVRAAMAHLNLVMIHPFRDGNGRMARALQTLMLAREGMAEPAFCSIEENLAHNEQAYYDVLAQVGQGRWNPGRDTAPWVQFNLTAHYRQALTVLRRIKLAELTASLADEVQARGGVPDRALPAVEHALSGYAVRNSTYRALAESDISHNVASRDLKALVSAGVFEQKGATRGAYYIPVEPLRNRVFELRRTAREYVSVGVDPYLALRRGEPLMPN